MHIDTINLIDILENKFEKDQAKRLKSCSILEAHTLRTRRVKDFNLVVKQT